MVSTGHPQIRILVVDDHQIAREGIRGLLLFNRTSWSSPKRRTDAKLSSSFVFIARTSQ